MHRQAHLTLLARRKAALLHSIHAHREELAGRCAQVLQPVIWADQVYARWREFLPATQRMAVSSDPMSADAQRPKTDGRADNLFRWAPLALNLFRSVVR